MKSGAYRKERRADDLPLPVGISDYRLASTEYYYVDKTMMIKEFIYGIAIYSSAAFWKNTEYGYVPHLF